MPRARQNKKLLSAEERADRERTQLQDEMDRIGTLIELKRLRASKPRSSQLEYIEGQPCPVCRKVGDLGTCRIAHKTVEWSEYMKETIARKRWIHRWHPITGEFQSRRVESLVYLDYLAAGWSAGRLPPSTRAPRRTVRGRPPLTEAEKRKRKKAREQARLEARLNQSLVRRSDR